MSAPSLQFTGLSKSFGAIEAVKDLTFTVEPNRVTGFLGPNGAGKTTTLKMLLGLVTPTSGTALVGGKPYTSLGSPMRTVGAHLEASAFAPGRTGRDHMRVACAQGGISPSQIEPLLELVSMTKDADRRMKEYSLGMLQRLGLATALLGDPQVLILDEPANGLDPSGIRWLREFLRAYAQQGRTVFLSSHLLGEIQQMAHDVIILNHGQLVTSGSVKELETANEASVIVNSPNHSELVSALQRAGFKLPGLSGAHSTIAPGEPITVANTEPLAVSQLALREGIPLTHLSQQTSGLEELFMSLTGGGQ